MTDAPSQIQQALALTQANLDYLKALPLKERVKPANANLLDKTITALIRIDKQIQSHQLDPKKLTDEELDQAIADELAARDENFKLKKKGEDDESR